MIRKGDNRNINEKRYILSILSVCVPCWWQLSC